MLRTQENSKYLISWDSKTTSSHFLDTIRLALRGILIHTMDSKRPTQNLRSFLRNCQILRPPNPHSVPVLLSTSVKGFPFRNIKFCLYSHPLHQPIKLLWLLSLSSSTLVILHRCVGQTFHAFIQSINKSLQWTEPRVQPYSRPCVSSHWLVLAH